MLNIRLQNSPEVEIEIAAEEQSRITKLRIEKLLES
jgi:2-oxo-4-hydroxy-4-carboxy--5-ureidoimidazoline (OHCU) decarboxylase